MTLHVCQAGYETFLAKELSGRIERSGPGWVLGPDAQGELCFAHLSLISPQEVSGKSVNALAGAVADFFTTSTKDERFEAPWPFCLESAGLPGLARRAKTVEEEVRTTIKSRMARVSKLAVTGRPALGPHRGLFAYMPDFDHVLVTREALAGGQRRMADDPQAPSRSYLKVEEAYGLLGLEPAAGETVADLGAAPGGWSYSAAKRGARVIAVDNGPLKGGALNHPLIEHRLADAFHFQPAAGEVFDWLFCDLVEEPHHVMQNIVTPWLANGWCRRFVINLKFGHVDALALLGELRAGESPFVRHAAAVRTRHLYHDREEFTVVGERA